MYLHFWTEDWVTESYSYLRSGAHSQESVIRTAQSVKEICSYSTKILGGSSITWHYFLKLTCNVVVLELFNALTLNIYLLLGFCCPMLISPGHFWLQPWKIPDHQYHGKYRVVHIIKDKTQELLDIKTLPNNDCRNLRDSCE